MDDVSVDAMGQGNSSNRRSVRPALRKTWALSSGLQKRRLRFGAIASFAMVRMISVMHTMPARAGYIKMGSPRIVFEQLRLKSCCCLIADAVMALTHSGS